MHVRLSCCRLYPVVFATSRIIAKDIELCGYHIPAGVRSLINSHSHYLPAAVGRLVAGHRRQS